MQTLCHLARVASSADALILVECLFLSWMDDAELQASLCVTITLLCQALLDLGQGDSSEGAILYQAKYDKSL
jgi:hypothetical protein